MTLTLPELNPHDPITVSVAAAIPALSFNRSDLANTFTFTQSLAGRVDMSGYITTTGNLSLGSYLAGYGSISVSTGIGLTIGLVSGSSTDLCIPNAANTGYVMEVMHGMSYPFFPNSGTYGGTWGTGSDLRLKTDVKPLENGLASALAVETITYRWNEESECDDKETTFMGVSAQSVQKVFPTAVMEDHRGYLTVDYGKLSVLALAAIKELSARLDTLESKQNS